MLTHQDIKTIKEVVEEIVGNAVAPLATKQEVHDSAASLATKQEVKNLATLLAQKANKVDMEKGFAKISGEMATKANILATNTEMKKGFARLERAIKREHKIGGEILDFLEVEDRKIKQRLTRVEQQVGINSPLN